VGQVVEDDVNQVFGLFGRDEKEAEEHLVERAVAPSHSARRRRRVRRIFVRVVKRRLHGDPSSRWQLERPLVVVLILPVVVPPEEHSAVGDVRGIGFQPAGMPQWFLTERNEAESSIAVVRSAIQCWFAERTTTIPAQLENVSITHTTT
jgi:hypothetical protein